MLRAPTPTPRTAAAILAVAGLVATATLLSGQRVVLAQGQGQAQGSGQAQGPAEVDTALVVSVDVSNSVDEHRYKLQMEGIAKALEDPQVLDAILSGPNGGILFTMVTWADKPQVAVPWVRIRSKEDAVRVARQVRLVPRHGGEFTCLARMMRFVSDKVVTQVPAKAVRMIVDVSGDGSDNCNPEEPVSAVRDELVEAKAIVNGLPILEGREAQTLAPWYTENVMGGPGSFVLPAEGFGDFGRAIRQKFVIEISGRGVLPPSRS